MRLINKRKKLLINKAFQLSFIGYIFSMSLMLIGIFALANNYFFWKFTKKGVAMGLPSDHIFFQFINDQRSAMNMIFLVTSVVTLVILIIFGLLLSNRIAGPLYRLTSQLREMTEKGKAKEVKFRKKDYFPEIAQAMNDFVKNKIDG